MEGFKFWIIWLKIVSTSFTIFGLLLVLLSNSYLFDILFNNHINSVFWDNVSLSDETLHFRQWIYGVLGATCVLTGVLIFFVVNNAFRNKELWAWNAILTGIVSWFILDEYISLYFNVWFNVIFNLGLLLLILIPLLLTRSYFSKSPKES